MKPAGPVNQGSERYVFEGFVVDVAAHTLTREGRACALEPKAFAVLTALLKRPGELLGRDELLDGIWGHRHVTPGVLTRAIAQLRSALGDDPQHPRYIQTQHALGYRFVAELHEQAAAVDPPDETAPEPAMEAREAYPQGAGSEAAAGALADPVPASRAPAPPSHASSRQRWMASLLVALVLGATWLWSESFGRKPAIAGASIAVLPFASISSDPGDAYFAEGLAVEMHDALAGVEGLTLAAQLSPDDPRLDGDIKALGSALGVASVLKASVRRDGRKVRISAQLSDTATGYSVWNKTYDRELADIFTTQAEIATEVAGSLVDILPAQRDALAERLQPTSSLAAFDFYLQGLGALRRSAGTDKGASAIVLFNRALADDSGFALAQAAICTTETKRFEYWHDSQAYPTAIAACKRAIEMDPGLGEAMLALADLSRVRGEDAQALAIYQKLTDDRMHAAQAHVGLAKIHAARGASELATTSFSRALALRPGDARIHAEIGFQAYRDRRLPDAIKAYEHATALQPNDATTWNTLGSFYLMAGDNIQARRALERSLALEPGADALSNLGTLRFLGGEYAAATELYRRATELDPGDHLNWGNLAEALLANSAPRADSVSAFSNAAARARPYLELNPDDAGGLAALGWYASNLGLDIEAGQLIQRSTELAPSDPEIALYNAKTLAALGEERASAQRMAQARAGGISEARINASTVLSQVVLYSRTGTR